MSACIAQFNSVQRAICLLHLAKVVGKGMLEGACVKIDAEKGCGKGTVGKGMWEGDWGKEYGKWEGDWGKGYGKATGERDMGRGMRGRWE